jgi:5-methylcytosine-specific restriction endonuclease McrA
MLNKRKAFSEVFKRIIACNQGYRCVGAVCKGIHLLPQTWELDHIEPISAGGSNHVSNLQLLCPNCHALKTQYENRHRLRRSPYFMHTHEKYIGTTLKQIEWLDRMRKLR